MSLFEPISSHWIHRWFAFLVAAIAVAVFVVVRRDHSDSDALRIATGWMLTAIGLQITLGVLVVLLERSRSGCRSPTRASVWDCSASVS